MSRSFNKKFITSMLHDGFMRRVGHKGADLIEPGNTLASFDAALAHGVDMIELDVLPERPPSEPQTDRLILAHDYEDAAERPTLTLEEALDHLASAAYAELEFIVDLKLPGYESRVVDALERSGLADRAIVSTTYRESLVAPEGSSPERAGRLVGAEGAAGLHPLAVHGPPRPGRAARDAAQAAAPGRRGAVGRAMPRGDGPLAAGRPRRWSRP